MRGGSGGIRGAGGVCWRSGVWCVTGGVMGHVRLGGHLGKARHAVEGSSYITNNFLQAFVTFA